MDDQKGLSKEAIRRRAERIVAQSAKDPSSLSPEKLKETVHELQVHQIELEIQNEELRRLQLELERSRARYFDLYDLAPVGYVTLNRSGVILEANLTLCSLLGVTRQTLEKRPLTHFILPADQDIFYKHKRHIVETDEPQTFELRLKHENGRGIWSRLRITSHLSDNGEPNYRTTLSDISTVKQTQIALRESENIFSQFMQHSPIYVFFKDKDLRSIRLSSNYEQMLGKPLPELLGKTMNDLFPSDLAKSMIADDQRILREKKPVEIEEELNGRFYTTTKFPIQSEGEMAYLAGYTIDITEEKQAKKALQESHNALEEALYTLQQTQAQLVKQERLAAVGQMAAGIAHDFNNILAIITLYTDTSLKNPNLPQSLHSNLSTIARQTGLAANLVQQIIDFSRQTILRLQLMDLTLFLSKQVNSWQQILPASTEIILSGETNSYVINADKTRIQQIFTNLILNARDAMPQRGTLHIGLSRLWLDRPQVAPLFPLPAGDWVQIIIRDSGMGIPAEVLAHIFEPFFTTKPPGKGSGLGLAQVYGIIKQHEGYIDVQSEVGTGTTFTIYLPLVGSEPLAKETAVTTKTETPNGRGETILIVEDNAILAEALESALAWLNYQTLKAKNGDEALSILMQIEEDQNAVEFDMLIGRQRVALVLSDLRMPEMDGQTLLQVLRKQGLKLPVVIMSGHSVETEIKTPQEWMVAGWLQKPIDMQELAVVLDKILH